MSKIQLREFEHEISQMKSMNEFLKRVNDDEFESETAFIGDIAKTYKQMFTNYLWKYKGEMNASDLIRYIEKFPLIQEIEVPSVQFTKFGEILKKFSNRYEAYRAILGDNDKYYTTKYGIKTKDGIIEKDYCLDLAFDNFLPDVVNIYADITAPYLVKLIGDDVDEYKKFENTDTPGIFLSNCYYAILERLKKLLPKWMTRGEKTNLWELK